MAYMKLGELLVSTGSITQEELEHGLELQKGKKARLGDVLIENGIISEDELIQALQMQLGIEFIDLTKYNIPTEMAQVLPKSIARQYQVVPVRVVKDELYLAMSDPMNFYAIEEVRKAVRRKIIPMVANKAAVERSIQVLYGNEGAARAIEDMRREAAVTGDLQADTETAFITNQLGEENINNAPTIRLVNSIIERAVTERASDVHLEPHETELLVRMRIDGMMRDILTVPRELQNSVLARLKIMAGMDIAERRIPQDGRFNIRIRDRSIDLRVSTLPTVYGEKIVARLLEKSGGSISLKELGLSDEQAERMKQLLRCRSGVILVVGPTGSGKTTTMYGMINELNQREVNLVTLEDPVEYNIDGINQVQINEKTGMTFANGLRAILRQDPDIIAVGEIRDGETAGIAMRAAITGHVVLSTVHTNDAIGTIERLEDIGVEPYLVAGAIQGMISQRLLRRICPDCREAYTPDEEEAADLGLEPSMDLKLYRGAGCPNCFNTGYRGRTAVTETLIITSRLRRMIAERCPRGELEAELKKPEYRFSTLRENALKLAVEGVTTRDEILRVINEED